METNRPAPPDGTAPSGAPRGSAPTPPSGPLGAPGLGGDWPAQATDAIVNAVDAVRDRTTGPIMTAARGLVFGVFAAALAVTVITLVIIAAIHFLDEVLPFSIWLPYLVLGIVFLVSGALVFRRRMAPTAGNTPTR